MSAPRLGEILVQAGACSSEDVREALQNQVIFGGRLGTNLLEIGAVKEADLAAALAKRYRLPALHGELALDPAILKLLRAELADRHSVIPYLLDGRKLALLVCAPNDLGMLDEVAFATGKQIHPIVAPEARIWALLRSAYGLERQLRGIEVDFAKVRALQAGRTLSGGQSLGQGAGRPGGDLMDEAEFDALYGKVGSAEPAPPGAIPAPTPTPTPIAAPAAVPTPTFAPPRPPPAPRPPPPRAVPPLPPAPAAPPPSPLRAAPPPPAAVRPPPPVLAPPPLPPEDVLELTDDFLEPILEPIPEPAPPSGAPLEALVLETLARAPGHAPPPTYVPPAAPAPRPEEPDTSALAFAEAVRVLEGIEDREVVARTVLRYARSHFKRSVLLTVNGGLARGWAGLGEGLSRERVAGIRIKTGEPGVLEMVVKTRAHFLGPLPRTEANIRLLKQLGGGVPKNVLAVPILALGRVVNVFYADAGRGGLVDDHGGVGELLILATRISHGYDTLVARRVR